jgi:hypothetical protein
MDIHLYYEPMWMQIQHSANLMDHLFTPTPCCQTKLTRIKMFHKCIFELNVKCVGNWSIDHLFNHYGSDAASLMDH